MKNEIISMKSKFIRSGQNSDSQSLGMNENWVRQKSYLSISPKTFRRIERNSMIYLLNRLLLRFFKKVVTVTDFYVWRGHTFIQFFPGCEPSGFCIPIASSMSSNEFCFRQFELEKKQEVMLHRKGMFWKTKFIPLACVYDQNELKTSRN